jgi:hypothetical protein
MVCTGIVLVPEEVYPVISGEDGFAVQAKVVPCTLEVKVTREVGSPEQ